MAKDYYSILGVDRGATPEKIREAYLSRIKLVHPDRFDQTSQPDAWAEANRMASDLNEAYSVLKNADTRRRYDASVGSEPHQPEPERQNNQQGQDAFQLGQLTPGEANFEDLPERTRSRLLERQKGGKDLHQLRIKQPGAVWNVVVALASLIWFGYVFVYLVDAPTWSEDETLWYAAISACVGLVLGWNVYKAARWFGASLKNNIFLTPLYIIETECDRIRFWPLWSVQDVNATHQYRNGWYQQTVLDITFANGTRSFYFPKEKIFKEFSLKYAIFQRNLKKHFFAKNFAYFTNYDDFRGFERGSSSRPREQTGTAAGYMLAAMCVSLVALWLASESNEERAGERWVYHANSASASASRSNEASTAPSSSQLPRDFEPRTRSAAPVPEQPLPRSGVIERNHHTQAVAPLEIVTRGNNNHYFVKLVDWNTDATILTAFIRGGQRVQFDVPLGRVKLKYATGTKWYGQNFLFGEATSYAVADSPFDFYVSENSVSGYTVELFLQANGNLETDTISASEF